MPESASVQALFGRIASRYDLANRVLSLGVDRLWRRRLVRSVRACGPSAVLDVATGSGDVAFALGRALPESVRIEAVDFCEPMLGQARRKRQEFGISPERMNFQFADALQLPFADSSFDAVTIAFGLRNLADRSRGLAEFRRVLRPGGRLWVLEFSQPVAGFAPLYRFYLGRVLPWLGGKITGEPGAYRYLSDTVRSFPGRRQLASEIAACGYSFVRARALTLGVAALHEAAR